MWLLSVLLLFFSSLIKFTSMRHINTWSPATVSVLKRWSMLMAKSTKLFVTLAVNVGGGREGKWNKNQKIWRLLLLCTLLANQVCVCVYVVLMCVSLHGCKSCILRKGVLFKFLGPFDPSLSKKLLIVNWLSLAVLIKVTKTAFTPSGISLYFFIFPRLLCCGARGKEREPRKRRKKKKPCDPLVLKGRKEWGRQNYRRPNEINGNI